MADLYSPDDLSARSFSENPSTEPSEQPSEVVPELLPIVHPAGDLADIDYFLPGCPPKEGLIKDVLIPLIDGKVPEIPKKSVCADCHRQMDHEVVSKAKPKDVRKIVNKALDGDFMGARDLLREVMVVQGTSGEDMVTQIYQEVSRMAMEDLIPSDKYIRLIESIGEYDYRIREGSNPRIQLEALLTKFLLK